MKDRDLENICEKIESELSKGLSPAGSLYYDQLMKINVTETPELFLKAVAKLAENKPLIIQKGYHNYTNANEAYIESTTPSNPSILSAELLTLGYYADKENVSPEKFVKDVIKPLKRVKFYSKRDQ